MSLSATCESFSQKKNLSSLLATHVVKKPKLEDGRRLQEAAIQLLEQQQDLYSLFREAGNPNPCNPFNTEEGDQKLTACNSIPSTIAGSFLVSELRHQAARLGVPLTALTVKMVLEKLTEISKPEEEEEEENQRREMLTQAQRVQLCALLESCRELLSHGALSPKLLWQEYNRRQKLPKLDVVFHLHHYNILDLKTILESDEGLKPWLVSQLKSLCSWTPPQEEQQAKEVQRKVLTTIVGILVETGFRARPQTTAANKRSSRLCCLVLDDMLCWLLDTVDENLTESTAAAEFWGQIFDASLCDVSASPEAIQSFFRHSLTQTLTYRPRLTVSDAITLQCEWTFAKASRLLTSLFRKLAVIFSIEQLLDHLQQVLETHEVNWKHVLCFLSTLLIYSPAAQSSLLELLSRLLSSAFEGYDLEKMIIAFLLARQGALEGSSIFPSYCDWFKISFGGGNCYHATSKKSLVFLLKFLSDVVPFEPPKYLKVHIVHPPYVPSKHRNLLMEYVSLAKTRLADLKESVEEMGVYEDVSGSGGSTVQCQAAQDVEKAVALFESTGKISAAVMEASIFRRPYFLTRFLPALLKPRVLPVKEDAWMSFIEALKKADKIPAAQYSSYVESCQRLRQQDGATLLVDTRDDPQAALQFQLQELRELAVNGNEGDISAHLSRISHTLSVVFPSSPEEPIRQRVIQLHPDTLPLPELHVKVVDTILRNFCQCMLDCSRAAPPNKQSSWASRFVSIICGNTQLLSSVLQRLWHLFHSQGPSLSAAHLLGLAAFVIHLHMSMSHDPLVQLVSPVLPQPVIVAEALSAALVCNTHANMLFCVRFCVAAVSYGICRANSLSEQDQQDYIPSSFCKKLQYLIPRLLPKARQTVPLGEYQEENDLELWSSTTDANSTWRRTAWSLWRHPVFQQLQHTPLYQFPFTEWLSTELRVQRSEDMLTDAERQEYQQWACLELYLPRREEEGGCGGDMKTLCARLIDGIMDQQSSEQSLETSTRGKLLNGSCLPDILCRLQELVYEMEVSALPDRAGACDFLFELVSQKLSISASSPAAKLSSELSLQHTLNTWNRVLLALPSVSFIKVMMEGGRTTLNYNNLIQHVNMHQRNLCSPGGLVMPFHVTAHFLRGVLSASARCGNSREEFDKAWRHISRHCPLLLVSTAYWWERLSASVLSLWRRLYSGDVPEQLQLLTDSQRWACSLKRGDVLQTPQAPPPLLAASLYAAWRGCADKLEDISTPLSRLKAERNENSREVLVFLLFLCMNSYLSALLHPQERDHLKAASFCTKILTMVAESADWLLIFTSNEQSVYNLVTSDDFARLMPWAFFSLLLQQSQELLHRATRCPGFLKTAIYCYICLLQLFTEGKVIPFTDIVDAQEPSHVLSRTRHFLLRLISQTSPTALSTTQYSQLQSQCADLDPEVAAALCAQFDPQTLSPEMDFL